ncbi:MAG: hypothetical protein OXP37_03940 [Chloroflexota bacterium]|nr:hypothetical protein [Chloroflexota bacterium]
MNSSELIRGKVAKVVNERVVAINVGASDGVQKGMYFRICEPNGLHVADPDTGEALGSVDVTKTIVKVTDVYDRLASATTYRVERVNLGGSGDFLSAQKFFQPPNWKTRVETLRLEQAVHRELNEDELFVHVGDPVVQTPNPDDYAQYSTHISN